MNVPSHLKYTRDHEWIRVEGTDAYVGVTDFAQRELGDIVYVEVSEKGNAVAKEAIFGSIEAVKTVSDLFMPLGGTILEVNDRLAEQPELVNTDPYGNGWIVKLSLFDPEQLEGLLSAEEYKKIVD